jgi:hypothetical protein
LSLIIGARERSEHRLLNVIQPNRTLSKSQ